MRPRTNWYLATGFGHIEAFVAYTTEVSESEPQNIDYLWADNTHSLGKTLRSDVTLSQDSYLANAFR